MLVCYACELKQRQNAADLLQYPTNDNKLPALSVVPLFSLIEQVGPGAFAIDFKRKYLGVKFFQAGIIFALPDTLWLLSYGCGH